jgi:hypothetical protein
MSRISFADAEYAGKRKKTRREVFPQEIGPTPATAARRPAWTAWIARSAVAHRGPAE